MTAPSVHAIGDSVMQGAGPELYATLPTLIPGITVDAEPNRQFRHAVELAHKRCAALPAPDILIVHLGTNGLVAARTFDLLIEAASCIGRLLIVNVSAPRDWVSEVNRQLAAGVERCPQRTGLVDWQGLVKAHPDLLHTDGFHMNRKGATAYAELLASEVV